MSNIIKIYTDGSCHTQLRIGAWAALLLLDSEKIILSGVQEDTTHNHMELLAVIKSIEYLNEHFISFDQLEVYTDSQYVAGINDRREKLKGNNFITKSGNTIQNDDLIKKLILQIETNTITFVKVKAHQKAITIHNYNREVDKIVRAVLRESVSKSTTV